MLSLRAFGIIGVGRVRSQANPAYLTHPKCKQKNRELFAFLIHGRRGHNGPRQNPIPALCQCEIHAFLRNLIRTQDARSVDYSLVRLSTVCTVRHTARYENSAHWQANHGRARSLGTRVEWHCFRPVQPRFDIDIQVDGQLCSTFHTASYMSSEVLGRRGIHFEEKLIVDLQQQCCRQM